MIWFLVAVYVIVVLATFTLIKRPIGEKLVVSVLWPLAGIAIALIAIIALIFSNDGRFRLENM
jgi:carbon starvation protein CstA